MGNDILKIKNEIFALEQERDKLYSLYQKKNKEIIKKKRQLQDKMQMKMF